MLRYFFDTEFYDDGVSVDLISIGIVCSDGREYYAASSEADLTRVSPWLRENVLPHLPHPDSEEWKDRGNIRRDIKAFFIPDPRSELWGYWGAYDWVCLCQLYGGMMNIPLSVPRYYQELLQVRIGLGMPPKPEKKGTAHNALDDARWHQELYRAWVGDPTAP